MRTVVDGISPNGTWPSLSITSTKTITVLVAVTCVLLTISKNPTPMEFSEFRMEDLFVFLAKLIAIALFIERTVEVLLTPWRGLEARRIAARVKQAKTRLQKGETDSVAEMSDAENELQEYKGKTRQIAFLMALALGMTISAVGIRGLQFFVDLPQSSPSEQTVVFHGLDVLLTGALLAGKADGLHKMALVWTGYLDKSTEKIKNVG